MTRLLAPIAVALLLPAFACAHDVRPGYLEIREMHDDTCGILWKVPVLGNTDLGAEPVLPRTLHAVGPLRTQDGAGWRSESRTYIATGGLTGVTIGIEGLDVIGDALVRVVRADGSEQVQRLSLSHDTFTIPGVSSSFDVARAYSVLGVEHILWGIDHLLFVLALLILVDERKRLISTITAFTLAHSITLAAATLGVVHVPSPPVEALIALSIVLVAAEIVHGRNGRPGLTARKPWIVAFTFGLLHGFGFAGALSEVGLPQHAIPTALLFFNVGVELGQLFFIACVLGLIAIARRLPIKTPAWSWRIPPYAIGGMAAFWVIQRVMAF